MSEFKITQKVIDLVQNLFLEGYTGTSEVVKTYPTGAGAVLDDSFSIRLTGFCKESLYITEDSEGRIHFVGRYNLLDAPKDPTVKDIVQQAWEMFLYYEARGYSRPYEFEELFLKYGKTVKKTVTVIEKA